LRNNQTKQEPTRTGTRTGASADTATTTFAATTPYLLAVTISIGMAAHFP